jgi:hypothetical protein
MEPFADQRHYLDMARLLDRASAEAGIDFLGGFGALVHKGATPAETALIAALPEVLSRTQRVCAFLNAGSNTAGLNMDILLDVGRMLSRTARLSRTGIGCAKFVIFVNAPEDNPFMAGAFHGVGEPDCEVHVGISGPSVVRRVVEENRACNLQELSDLIKRTVFKITRAGELIGREVARGVGVPFGIVDISLAPTIKEGDSVAQIIEAMGVEKMGAPGTTAAVALLMDAVKKGGAMASQSVGGLSGTFIPVSEDLGMVRAIRAGALSLEKLEALTAVCSVGMDMFFVPGNTPPEKLSAIIADELAIGVINNKTTAVRVVPIPGKKAGDYVRFGALLGEAPVMRVNKFSADAFIRRGGRIPAPITSLRN